MGDYLIPAAPEQFRSTIIIEPISLIQVAKLTQRVAGMTVHLYLPTTIAVNTSTNLVRVLIRRLHVAHELRPFRQL